MSMSTKTELPFIDRRVEHIGVSKLRQIDGKTLKENVDNKAIVIREHDLPLAVLLSYEQYLVMQDQLNSLVETIEILSSADEFKLLAQGMSEFANQAPRKTIEQIRASLKRG